MNADKYLHLRSPKSFTQQDQILPYTGNTVYRVDKNGEEATYENDEDHPQLNLIKNGTAVLNAQKIRQCFKFKYSDGKRQPCDRTEWSKDFQDRLKQVTDWFDRTGKQAKTNADHGSQCKADGNPQEADNRVGR